MMTKTKITRMKEIQSGERTHHQDQVMTPTSLRTMKMTVRTPARLRPPDEFEEFDISVPFSADSGRR
jgi:hypothetical protein